MANAPNFAVVRLATGACRACGWPLFDGPRGSPNPGARGRGQHHKPRQQDDQEAGLHRQALFTNVGLALSQWAGMEDLLVGIASLLLRTHEATKVGIILYSIGNPYTWLNIIGELFSQEPRYITLKPRWNKLSERIIKLNDTRVRLAHHTIYSRRVDDLPQDKAATLGETSLRPGQFDVRPKSQKHRFEPLDYDQISKFIDSVNAIMNDLRELLNAMTDILQRETSQQKSSQSTTDQHHP
jgi:hypothetical protein